MVNRLHKTLLIGFTIALSGSVVTAQEQPATAPLEGLFDIGTHKLFLKCTGQGAPTVILDGRATSPHTSWVNIQPRVAEFTRVCSYDRAGLGQSEKEPSGKVRTSQALARDLKTLLDRAEIKGPYVVVGALFGSFNARAFVTQNLPEVAGVVLVEAENREVALNLSQFVLAVEPWDVVQSAKDAEALDSTPGLLGDRPLMVVTRGQNLTTEWDLFHKSLLPLSSNSKQIYARNSNDEIPRNQPDLVIEAVKAVVDAVRNNTPLNP